MGSNNLSSRSISRSIRHKIIDTLDGQQQKVSFRKQVENAKLSSLTIRLLQSPWRVTLSQVIRLLMAKQSESHRCCPTPTLSPFEASAKVKLSRRRPKEKRGRGNHQPLSVVCVPAAIGFRILYALERLLVVSRRQS